MSRMRADLLLVARGLAESRAKARAAIEAGGVIANGVAVAKPSDLLDKDAAGACDRLVRTTLDANVKRKGGASQFAFHGVGQAVPEFLTPG